MYKETLIIWRSGEKWLDSLQVVQSIISILVRVCSRESITCFDLSASTAGNFVPASGKSMNWQQSLPSGKWVSGCKC